MGCIGAGMSRLLNLIYILIISCFFTVNLFSGDSKVKTKRESCTRLLPVKKDGKYGYIDTTGKIVVPPQWDYAQDFQDGIAMVMQGNKQGYIDKTGKYIWGLSE